MALDEGQIDRFIIVCQDHIRKLKTYTYESLEQLANGISMILDQVMTEPKQDSDTTLLKSLCEVLYERVSVALGR